MEKEEAMMEFMWFQSHRRRLQPQSLKICLLTERKSSRNETATLKQTLLPTGLLIAVVPVILAADVKLDTKMTADAEKLAHQIVLLKKILKLWTGREVKPANPKGLSTEYSFQGN